MGIYQNDEQEMALRIVCEHVIERKPSQLLMHIVGTRATGKSYVIDAIVQFFDRVECSVQLRVTAPTGCTAVLIRGSTIHSLMGLPQRNGRVNQSDLEVTWQDVSYLIIDEISMVSVKLLSDISHRLCLAKSADTSASDKPFGNMNVIFTGDFRQLHPVGEQPVFGYKLVQRLSTNVAETPTGQFALHGACLWRQVNCVVILRKNWCAQNDAPYINLLGQVRKGIAWTRKQDFTEEQRGTGDNYDSSDYDTLGTRRVDYLLSLAPSELEAFHDAPIVVPRKQVWDAMNLRKAGMFTEMHNHALHLYKSKDFRQKEEVPSHLHPLVWSLSPSTTNDALGNLPLCAEMPVMITENLSITNGVVNGAQGTVENVSFSTDEEGNRYATCVFVHIPRCNINIVEGKLDMVPIMPSSVQFCFTDASNTGFMVKRMQVPLLPAFMFTDYKAQGCSLEYVVVNLASSHSLQSIYVMLSCAMGLKRVLILRWFPSHPIFQSLSQDLRNKFDHLELIAEHTVEQYTVQRGVS